MGLFEKASSWLRERSFPPDRRESFDGRVAFVTGGTRGLGLELARELGRRGALVAFCGRDRDEVARAENDLSERGVVSLGIVADVREREDVERAVAAIVERWGLVDLLINNAGIIQVGPLDALTRDDVADALATHFWAPYDAIAAVLPAMRERKRGRIVNVSSIGGRVAMPHLLAYGASKFALAGFSEGLRAELVRERVYVTTVIPGLMRTGSPERASFKGKHRAEYAWFSIADSLPFLSVDVVEAARRIVDAAERGDATCTISLPAKLAAIAHGIAPSVVQETLGVVARFLPAFGGIGSASRSGAASHSAASPSPLTLATQRRAVTQQEVSR